MPVPRPTRPAVPMSAQGLACLALLPLDTLTGLVTYATQRERESVVRLWPGDVARFDMPTGDIFVGIVMDTGRVDQYTTYTIARYFHVMPGGKDFEFHDKGVRIIPHLPVVRITTADAITDAAAELTKLAEWVGGNVQEG